MFIVISLCVTATNKHSDATDFWDFTVLAVVFISAFIGLLAAILLTNRLRRITASKRRHQKSLTALMSQQPH
jgi:Kef-type K+ transport system membrane component KefB